MKKKWLLILALLIGCAPGFGQGQFSGGGSSGTAKKFQSLAAPPGTCTKGDVYFDTTNGFYGCTAANTWTAFTAGGAAFNAITAGTNTNALVIGNGGSLGVSGTGTITATALTGIGNGSIAVGTAGALSSITGLTCAAATGCNIPAPTGTGVGLTVIGDANSSNVFNGKLNGGATGCFESSVGAFQCVSNGTFGSGGGTVLSGAEAAPTAVPAKDAIGFNGALYFSANGGTFADVQDWGQLHNPSQALSLTMGANDSTFNYTTGSQKFNWTNTTAATSGTPQSSPSACWNGFYWNGSASTLDQWCFQDSVASGTNGIGTLTFAHSGAHASVAFNGNGSHGLLISGLEANYTLQNNTFTDSATYQGGKDTSGASSTGGTGNFRGADVTGGAGTGGGSAVFIRGGNSASSSASTVGGAVSINGGNVTAATNIAGANVTITGGLGTGTSVPARVFIKYPTISAASGTGAQTAVTNYVVWRKALSTTSAQAQAIFTIPVASNQTAGVMLVIHLETTEATPHNCSTTQEWYVSVQNTGGTITQNASSATASTICDSGTLTMTAQSTTASSPVSIQVTPSWTTIAPVTVFGTVEVHNLSNQEITLQ